MKYKIIFLVVAFAISAHAVITRPVTPRSYVVSFAENVLPPNAKVTGIDLQVERAEAVRVRSMPPGWIASTFRPQGTKIESAIEWFTWGKDQGIPVLLPE